MTFHENCSKCVKLTHGKQIAERVGYGYDYGVVFSRKPLKIDKEEIFQLKIESTIEKWAGSLRIGVTNMNPSDKSTSLRALTDLFSHSQHDCNFWIWAGDKLHRANEQATDLKITLHDLEIQDLVGVQVRRNGQLYFYRNGNKVNVACGLTINQDLYVVFDIYGTTKSVSYVSGGGTLKDLCSRHVLEHLESADDIDKLPLPQTVRFYLKDRCNANVLGLKRKRKKVIHNRKRTKDNRQDAAGILKRQ